MGGLRKKIRWTFLTMMCAAVAIAGIPPFSGFFSKDAILLAAHHHAPWMYWVGTITAGMTAFYVFRAMFLTFFGEYRGHEHPHESPPVMILPLAVLAVLSLAGGFLFKVPAFLGTLFPTLEAEEDIALMAISTAAGIHRDRARVGDVRGEAGHGRFAGASSLGGLYKLVYNKYFVDEIYDAAVVTPTVAGSRDAALEGHGRGADRWHR